LVTLAVTVRESPSITGEVMSTISTAKAAGSWTVTDVLSVSFSLATVRSPLPASPGLVAHSRATDPLDSPPASVTSTASRSTPSKPVSFSVIVRVAWASPVLVTLAVTVRTSPSVTGEVVSAIVTLKIAGSCTVTDAASVSFSLATVTSPVPASPSAVVHSRTTDALDSPPAKVTSTASCSTPPKPVSVSVTVWVS